VTDGPLPLDASAVIQAEMAPGLKSFEHLTDITCIVQDSKFYLHKAILTARCKWFEAMFKHNFKEKVTLFSEIQLTSSKESPEILIESMSAAVFKKVVEYLYTGIYYYLLENISNYLRTS
jgi:hypothetical protein